MQKIIAAFDGLKYAASTGQYSIQLARQTNAFVVGVFLDDTSYSSYNPATIMFSRGGLAGSIKRKWDKKDEKTRAVANKKFELACRNAGVSYAVHHDRHSALKELLLESIYADLLVVNSGEIFKRSPADIPTPFIKQLLLHARCPVLVVPEQFTPISSVIMLYDGEVPSVQAIKMFSYFTDASPHPALEIVSVMKTGGDPGESHFTLLKEWMSNHLPGAQYTRLYGEARDEIVKHLSSRQGAPLVVLGLNNQGRVTRWLNDCVADTLMQELQCPLFIVPNH